MHNSNQPINPVESEGKDVHGYTVKIKHLGLTKREYFAGLAMQGLLSSMTEKAANGAWMTESTLIAEHSVTLADELLKELSK
jgi:hypothetical protein